jgi:hypothetical protein
MDLTDVVGLSCLNHLNGEGTNVSLPLQPSAAHIAVAAALRTGLLRLVAGYQTVRVCAVEHSQQLIVAPPPQPATSGGAASRGGGDMRPEVLLAPWHDHVGRLNAPYLRQLVGKVLLAAERSPGAPEGRMVAALNFISPVWARVLLRTLAAQGMLSVRQLRTPLTSPARNRPSLLGGGRKSALTTAATTAAASGYIVTRHYSPVMQGGLPTSSRLPTLPCAAVS